MQIFKEAYKFHRANSKEIYKGFGLKHLSDVTQYYVHPNNQSFNGTTSLCQPIGEAIILFATVITNIKNDEITGDFYNGDNSFFYFNTYISNDYHVNQIINSQIFSHRAMIKDDFIFVSNFDINEVFIENSIKDIENSKDLENAKDLYLLLPAFCALLAREMSINPDFSSMMLDFVENPVVDTFVNLHEDFYQSYKLDNYQLKYIQFPKIDENIFTPFSTTYKIINENKREQNSEVNFIINKFSKETFTDEQKEFIPSISKEFILPTKFHSICNAIVGGDMLAVLLHGPAGTGKTMACKLMAQSIGLPIMETINCTESLDEFILGKFIPEEDKIIFKESYVTKAIAHGGAVVFEEINFAKPQNLAFLNSLLDDNGFVRLDNNTTVKRHANFRFFATMNIGYYGTKNLNQALYNRFNGIIEISSISDEAIKRMLLARVPECQDVLNKILGVYHKILKNIEAEELDLVISPRNLENWVRLAKYEGYIKASEKTIIPIARGDYTLEDTIRGIIMIYKWK